MVAEVLCRLTYDNRHRRNPGRGPMLTEMLAIRLGSAFARHRRVEKLLLPQVRHAAAGHVILEELNQCRQGLGPRVVALPFARERHPRHHVAAGRDHALDRHGLQPTRRRRRP